MTRGNPGEPTSPRGKPVGYPNRLSPGALPGFPLVESRGCNATRLLPGETPGVCQGEVGNGVPLVSTRFSPGVFREGPWGNPRDFPGGKRHLSDKPRGFPGGSPGENQVSHPHPHVCGHLDFPRGNTRVSPVASDLPGSLSDPPVFPQGKTSIPLVKPRIPGFPLGTSRLAEPVRFPATNIPQRNGTPVPQNCRPCPPRVGIIPRATGGLGAPRRAGRRPEHSIGP